MTSRYPYSVRNLVHESTLRGCTLLSGWCASSGERRSVGRARAWLSRSGEVAAGKSLTSNRTGALSSIEGRCNTLATCVNRCSPCSTTTRTTTAWAVAGQLPTRTTATATRLAFSQPLKRSFTRCVALTADSGTHFVGRAGCSQVMHTDVEPCEHFVRQHLGQPEDHGENGTQQETKGRVPREELPKLSEYTGPAGRCSYVTPHGEERFGCVVNEGVGDEEGCEQSDHGQGRAHKERHEQQVTLCLRADEGLAWAHVHDCPQGRCNDGLNHAQHPANHGNHEDGVGQAGNRDTEVVREVADVLSHLGDDWYWDLKCPVPDV